VEKSGSGPMCYWCEKKGHRQKDCKRYLAVKKRDKESKNRQAQKEEEAGNIAIAKDEYDSSLYLPEQAMTVTSAAVQWTLDSRATKHFTGIKSDIQQLKRWNEPRVVQIANGVTVEAEGYSIVSLGQLQLSEVWYVSAFKSLRLLSVKSLTLEGYTTVFEENTAICLMYRDTVFEACIRQRTYIVEEGKVYFTDRRENDDYLDLDLNLDTTCRLDESNADL
jgi:hypothetical protein